MMSESWDSTPRSSMLVVTVRRMLGHAVNIHADVWQGSERTRVLSGVEE